MKSYVNYRYQDFQNQSFHDEFRVDSDNYADFAKVKRSALTSFCGADLTRARFVNAALQNCDFTMAKLEDVDWCGATFNNCKFPKGWSPNWQEAITQDIDANQSIEKLATKKSQ